VVLAAASGALINELQAGWPWWVAAAFVVLVSAGLASWLAAGSGPAGDDQRAGSAQQQARHVRIGRGAIRSGRDIKIDGSYQASGTGSGPAAPFPLPGGGKGSSWDVQGLDATRDVHIKGDLNTRGGDPA
jgi:hypothetical protein